MPNLSYVHPGASSAVDFLDTLNGRRLIQPIVLTLFDLFCTAACVVRDTHTVTYRFCDIFCLKYLTLLMHTGIKWGKEIKKIMLRLNLICKCNMLQFLLTDVHIETKYVITCLGQIIRSI